MPIAAAGIGAGASLLSSIIGKGAASKAAKQQAAMQQAALGQQQRQFDTTQANFAPFLQAGTGALGAYQGLLGMQGGDTQQQAIDALKASPGFTSLYNQGADTILQNGAATGGLRGGNMQLGLANFGSSLLGTVIQNQLGNYGGLISAGSGAANSMGSFGQANSNAQSQLLQGIGNTQAAGTIGGATALNNGLGGVSKALMDYFNSRGGGAASQPATGYPSNPFFMSSGGF